MVRSYIYKICCPF